VRLHLPAAILMRAACCAPSPVEMNIDPPHTFNARSAQASMAIHNYGFVGAYGPPHVVEQAKRFIESQSRRADRLLER
jgi:hypothetical protein